jgi:hypothetical protein
MRVLGHGGPAFLGLVSLRAQSAAELGSRDYARNHNRFDRAESSIPATMRVHLLFTWDHV